MANTCVKFIQDSTISLLILHSDTSVKATGSVRAQSMRRAGRMMTVSSTASITRMLIHD